MSLNGRFVFTSVCPAFHVLCPCRFSSLGVYHTVLSIQSVICSKWVRSGILCWSSVAISSTVSLFYFGVWALVRLCRSLCFSQLVRSCLVFLEHGLLEHASCSVVACLFLCHLWNKSQCLMVMARRWLRRHVELPGFVMD